jgi:polysaccharide export outer membrane protein
MPDAPKKFCIPASACRWRRARPTSSFKPQWDAKKGAEQLYKAYRASAITLEDFEGPRYQRIGHINKLLADGILETDLRHRTTGNRTSATIRQSDETSRTISISVLGEVGTPSRFPANAAGERLLDAISRAGGPRNPGFDTFVTLEREGRQATAPFGSLLNEPINNIYVRPQDTIYVFTQPQTFVAFGASGQQGQFGFGAWRLSIAEALGKTGGLNDNLADPASVYLYRGERREVAEQLGVDCSRFSGPVVPVIYNLNLRDPAGYFLATKFEMHNKDVIFSSNSASVESSKLLTYLRLITATVNDPLMAAVNAYTVKGLATGTASATVVNTTSSVK